MGLTDWDLIEETINGELNKTFGELFLVRPMTSRPNKPTVIDTERGVETEVCGQFTRKSVQDDFNPSALSSRGLKFTDAAQRDPILEFKAIDLPFTLHQGDQLTRCANGVVYEVGDPRPNGHGIYFAKLIERGVSESTP